MTAEEELVEMADDDFGNELKTITDETDEVQRKNAFEELYYA